MAAASSLTDAEKDKLAGLEDFEATPFEQLEKDFQEVLSELVGDQSLDRFRLEYEKLHRALKKSHEQEKRLIKKVRELTTEIVNNAGKVATALKLSEEDDVTIEGLKKQIEKAWKMVAASHEKEVKATETIQKLKNEIAQLSRLVEKSAGLVGQGNTVEELLKVREVLTRRVEDGQNRIAELAAKNDELIAELESKSNKNKQRKAELGEMKAQLSQRQAEQERQSRMKERVEKELQELKDKLEAKNKDAANLSTTIKDQEAKAKKQESQLREARATMEKYLRDFDALYANTQKLTEQLDEQMHRSEMLTDHNISLEQDLKAQQDEVARGRQEKSRLLRHLDNEKKESKRLREKLNEEKTAQNELQAQLASLKKELNTEGKEVEVKLKEIEGLHRERDHHRQKLVKEGVRSKEHKEKFEQSERTVQHLESKITRYRNEAVKARNVIYQLEKDREKYGIQAAEAQTKLMRAEEEVKLRENQMAELEKKEAEVRARLKQQQQMYEAVRADRNLYSKNLIEAQDEIAEMKRKFKIMNHQIEQLKEEITAKDRALVAEHFEHQSVEKQLEQCNHTVSRLKKLLASSDAAVTKQDAEIGELNNTIRQMDEDGLRQRKEYDQVITERDILGTQLIRRNDELALLYEQVKILKSTLEKGHAQYAERLQDIRVLRLKIKDIKRELKIATSQVGQLSELKREVYRLQRELLQERTKVKALSEELENPMNVHRWRKLEGSDPATYEMIQKIQTLQKRLIAKTEEAVEKELLIQEKEKLYVELKNILARQPGPEVAEQLSVYQQNLKEKTRQMKAMASELNMYQAQINEYKYEIERVTRELQDVKRKYYEQKRRDALAKTAASYEATKASAATRQAIQQAQAAQASTARFTGGGFNLQA